jgi:hypothetical protein
MIDVMSKRGIVFGGMDIPEFYRVAKALFTPEEAEINNAMPRETFTAAELAGIMGRDEAELATALKQMADKGLCTTHMKGDLRLFRAAPFVPGIFEFVMMRGTATERDKELARRIKEYKDAWEARSPIVIPYPMQRVIAVDEAIEPAIAATPRRCAAKIPMACPCRPASRSARSPSTRSSASVPGS